MPVASKITVDFSNVKDRGEFSNRALPEGDYIAKITDVNLAESSQGNTQLIFKIEVEGVRAASYPFYCGLDEKQLWKLRNLCVAAGLNAPKKRLALDPNKLIGKLIGIELMDDEYEGRVKSKINGVFPKEEVAQADDIPDDADTDDVDDEDDEDEAPAPKKRATKKRQPEPEPEDDDDEDDEEEEEAPAPKRKKAPAKKKPAPVEDDEDEEDDEMEIDEI